MKVLRKGRKKKAKRMGKMDIFTKLGILGVLVLELLWTNRAKAGRSICQACFCTANVTSCRGQDLAGVTNMGGTSGQVVDLRGSQGFPWDLMACQDMSWWTHIVIGDSAADCASAQKVLSLCGSQAQVTCGVEDNSPPSEVPGKETNPTTRTRRTIPMPDRALMETVKVKTFAECQMALDQVFDEIKRLIDSMPEPRVIEIPTVITVTKIKEVRVPISVSDTTIGVLGIYNKTLTAFIQNMTAMTDTVMRLNEKIEEVVSENAVRERIAWWGSVATIFLSIYVMFHLCSKFMCV